MRITIALLLCGLMLLVPSCKSKAKPSIIGKWESMVSGSVEFRTDGSATIVTSRGARQVKYRMVDETTIELFTPEGVVVAKWTILKLTADELVATNLEGSQTTFRRAAP